MNDNGWIKIRKSIYNHWLWEDAEYLKWWIDLLLMANWEDDKKLVGKQLVEVKRGQLIASMSFLMNRWGRSRKMIEHFLNLLYKEQMISKDVKHNISLITISNYDKHQANDKETSKAQKGASKGACNGAYLEKDLTTNKSETYNTNESDNGAHLGAYQGAEIGAHLGTHLGAYQGATIKEYKESKEDKNNISSLNSELCLESKDSKPLCMCAHEEIETFDMEDIVDTREEIPWRMVQQIWNTSCPSFSRLVGLSDSRKNKLKVRLKEMGGLEMFETICKKMEESNFLKGDNQKGWRATFDWVITNSNNWVKIYEGQFDNRQQRNYGNTNNQRSANPAEDAQRRRVEEFTAEMEERLKRYR